MEFKETDFAGLPEICFPPALTTLCSSSVFHSPQLGHLPCHLGVLAPQLAQTKIVVDLGIYIAKLKKSEASLGFGLIIKLY
jgi:hypothetical protein